MEVNILISDTVFCLKESFRVEKDTQSTIADKMFISGYIEYVKTQVIPKGEKYLAIFDEFRYNPDNMKIEGKFELILEEGFEINGDKKSELHSKIELLKQYFTQKSEIKTQNNSFVEEKNVIQKEEIKKAEKDEVIENEDFEEIDENTEIEIEERLINAYKENADGLILVPWDFSEKAEQAFAHAANYSKMIGGEVDLLHIVKNEDEVRQAEQKLKDKANELFARFGVKPSYIIRAGNIFTTISEVATQSKAKVVFMGTHGMKGMQKITGSWALKVLIDSKAPFIVVQDSPESSIMHKILFPIDKSKESRQKIKYAQLIAEKNPNAVFQICRLAKSPNDYFERMISTNTNYVRSYFRQTNIKHEVLLLEGSNLSDSIIKYSAANKVDLIMILTTQNINITNYMIGLDEQKIIFNKYKIPVMCINPMKVKYISVNGFGGTQ